MVKKALCLSGGATRGTFQMGAIKCLYEVFGFRPDIITGTSVGAINGIKLACAPPPTVNDSAAILAAVSSGTIDPQLKHMRDLEQFWIPLNGRKEFFAIKPTFQGTMIEDALAQNQATDMAIGTKIDLASAAINLPLIHLFASIYATTEIQKIKSLIEKISVENSVADLSPVENKLRAVGNIIIGTVTDPPPYINPPPIPNNLFYGTPLYMAMVSLETGKLRYATNTGAFFERDGVSPVFTALMDSDVDMALDENLLPLAKARKDNIKLCIAKYASAVNQMAAYHPELSNNDTPKPRKAELAAATARERERGNYYARAAKQQLQGVRITSIIHNMDPMKGTLFAPDPIKAALASASLPALLEPQQIGAERYVDAGLREIIPIEIVLDKNVDQIVGIICSTQELPETDSKKDVGLIEIGIRAAVEITINEVTRGDVVTAAGANNIDTRIIAPTIDVHSGFDLDPSLIEISMHYGWLRAADEMHPVAAKDQRKTFRQSSELLTRLRLKCSELEGRIQTTNIKDLDTLKWSYYELRLNRWAIMHVVAGRTNLGLPTHPAQAMWSIDWERDSRGGPTVWAKLESRSIDSSFQADLWPPSSPPGFNPDMGTIEDAGSDRIYWVIRGAIFEDKTGTVPAVPLPNVVLPSGLHQYLPRIPTGMHLMAETQDQTKMFLIAGGKKFASPTPAFIAAAGLTGATVAIVPSGGLMQIPDGGVPFFLGSLSIVDAQDITLSEINVERVQNSNTTVDISIHNRSTTATISSILISPTGFDSVQGISVENPPTIIPPNTIDFFTLRLKPTAAGQFNGSIAITSNDPFVPTMAVGLKFKVLPFGDMADLAAAPSPLEINAPVNSTSSYTMLAITNNSDVTPNSIAVLFEPAAIQSLFNTGINLNAGSFTRGNSVQLPIFFYPTAAGRVNGELVLKAGGMTSTNQPYERTVRVPLIGNAGTSTIRLLGRKPTARDFESDDPRRPRPGRGAPQTSLRLNIGTIQPPVSNAVSFSILNLGQIDLEIPTMLGNFASSPPNQIFPIKIGPGEWTAVKLDLGIYHAPGIGAFTETVRILCNDPVTPEAHVIIDGAVGGAKGSIVPDFIDFSFVSVNSSVQRTTVFQNKGTVDFHVNKIVWQTGTFFRLAPPPTLPYLVPAGGSLTLDIEFGPVSVPGFYGDSFILGTSEGIFANLGVQAKAQ